MPMMPPPPCATASAPAASEPASGRHRRERGAHTDGRGSGGDYCHQAGDLETHGLVDFSDMTRFDAERLHRMIENHLHYTGSERASTILENWPAYLPKFVKVMPVDYRRALEETELAQEPELDPFQPEDR